MPRKLSYEEVKEYIESFGYKLLSKEYIGSQTKLLIQCDKNHKPYETTFNNFKGSKNRNGRRCPYCANEHKGDYHKHNYEYVKDYIESFEYKLLSTEYKNNRIKLDIVCSKGHKFEMTFDSFEQGFRCPICKGINNAERCKLDYEEVKKYIESFNYKLISTEYINNRTKLDVVCPNGHKSKMNYDRFKQGCRCSICNESKGEKEVENILNKYNINFMPQYKFNDCKFKRELPFDFYLLEYNCCIEYDGEQHYEPIDFGGKGEEYANKKFQDQIKKDNIKTKYCRDNNIKLIRIAYWDFDNIEKIIVNKLKLE